MSAEYKTWRAGGGGRTDGLADLFETAREMGTGGWRDVRLESVEFNDRYRLRTKDRDDLEVLGIFDPAMIVGITDRATTGLTVEMDGDNLLLAIPGRILDEATLDTLLTTADQVGRDVDSSPAPR